jgi:hypothetical protein
MIRPRSAWFGIATAMVVAAWLLLAAPPLAAQGRQRDGGESTGSAAVPAAPSAPAPAPVASPPATPSSSGGSSDSGSSSSGGQTRSGGGGRTDRGAGGTRTGTATPRGTGSRTAAAPPGSDTTSGKGSTTTGRTRDGGEVVATAVPRTSTPGGGGGGGNVVIVPGGWYGFYPWAYGGLGFGGYYGYYGGYDDPWLGGYSSYSSSATVDGALRVKVKPREASVYVDGYFAGQVDDFDGVFQRLHLSPGPHRIEIREPKYEILSFDVQIDPDHTITYRGELQKIL